MAEIESEHASIRVVVAPEQGLRRGVISMAHCFGGDPLAQEDLKQVGASVARLISVEKHFDPLTGMARQSAIPVRIRG
jgi:anaerobic selenocysteine-containing dehydrogenase